MKNSWGTAITIITVIVFLSLYVILKFIISKPKLPLPPGPKPLPLLGNLFDIPSIDEHKAYTEWRKKYGDVIYINAAGKHMVILNSFNAARDLFDKRSTIYCDRPFLPMLNDPRLMDMNWSFAFAPYSPEWRRQRRLFMQHLGPSAAQLATLEAQKSAAHMLLRSLLHTPKEYFGHLKHAAAGIILRITYGYQIQQKNDPIVTIVENFNDTVGEAVLPGRFLVNLVPSLKYVPEWFPGSGFKKWAVKSREFQQKHVNIPFEYAKQNNERGTALPSFVTSALTDAPSEDLITDVKYVAGTMYGGGAETTSSSMKWCVLALVLHQEVQQRAQRELDSVIGNVTSPTFRLPTFQDRPNLPYIDAIVKETLRWFPVVPLGLPHATTEEDTYRGWRIPKGSIVMANLWSIMRDENTYPDPQVFRPERFLGENPAPDPSLHGCFGFGRRDCPGRYVADLSLWIQIANILAAFTLSPAKDENGREIDIWYARETMSSTIKYVRSLPAGPVSSVSVETLMPNTEAHRDFRARSRHDPGKQRCGFTNPVQRISIRKSCE